MPPVTTATDGVRLLSHRPSVLFKVEHLASEPAAGDVAVEGLLLAGPLIARYGYITTVTAYCAVSLVLTALIAFYWREHLWKLDAPANTR